MSFILKQSQRGQFNRALNEERGQTTMNNYLASHQPQDDAAQE